MSFRVLNYWRIALLYLLLGPLVGLFALMLSLSLASVPEALRDGSPTSLFDGFGFIISAALSIAYLIGSVPALVCGFLAPALWPLGDRYLPWASLGRALVGAATGVVATSLFCLFALGPPEFLRLAPVLLGAGGASGAICSLIATWLRVGPNKSFKPKPLRGSA